jgi:AAA15 family ATPase/GTPase
MENSIKLLRIQNFKSIKDVTLHPRRVNLLIGEPNVGKSNLLEAMSLLGAVAYEQTERFLSSFIRYEEPRQLFYDNLVGNSIKVETDNVVSTLSFDKETKQFNYLFGGLRSYQELLEIIISPHANVSVGREAAAAAKALLLAQASGQRETKLLATGFVHASFGIEANMKANTVTTPRFPRNRVSSKLFSKSYNFKKSTEINQDSGRKFLTPPHGGNLIEVIQTHAQLRKEIGQMFERYGQKLQLRVDERRLEVIKDQEGITYSYPYSSVADTLQRIIFYLAAIESNDEAVLLFEEPEAHSFPVYVSRLGRRIVESRNNQFFIDTHSLDLITEVLEEMLTDETQAGELAIFAAYYEDYQTKIHQLSDEEIRSIRNDGIDVFYNIKRFTTGVADA